MDQNVNTPRVLRGLPLLAWDDVDSFVDWRTLGSFFALSRERRDRAMLEAVRRVAGGDLHVLSRVVIHGLHTDVALNGARGICMEFHGETGRWLVELVSSGKLLNIKPNNLRVIGRIARPMTSRGSSRGARQIAAALPTMVLALKTPHEGQVRAMLNQQLRHFISQGQGGVMLALARIAGISQPSVDRIPDNIEAVSCRELNFALSDLCSQNDPPRVMHLEALLRAGAKVNVRNERHMTPLECLACSSADSANLLGPVKLLIRFGAHVHPGYIRRALLNIEQWDDVSESVLELRSVWTSLKENTSESRSTDPEVPRA